MNLNPNLPEPMPANSHALAAPNAEGGQANAPAYVPGKSKNRLSGQIACMVIIVAVSAATIFFMRQYGVKAGINFDTVAVEYQQPDEAKARTYQRIMADLSRIQKPMEVALGEFGASPFMLDRPVTRVNPANPTGPEMTPEEIAAEAERRRVEQEREEMLMALRNLKLQGVMGGSVPLARISDRTYRVGDVIYDVFTITKIEGREVTVQCKGESFTISMEDVDAGPKASPMRGKN